ncbi:hypothetical protein FGO68_gene3988 [Halteria grandinella]|uniref:Uncharacterized protein n=1 Tax=Halteria grandinella TaxID=5974 RepID=A0A8J8SWV9_HALGN|nr:hypothetical protein FGO68_gene3988 [Halteria grandinella]
MFNKFRPTKVIVDKVEDISLLLKYLPSSVTYLRITFADQQCIMNQDETPRKFKQLALYNCKQTLDILSKHATATESLIIDSKCLEEPGVIDYLTQLDCKLTQRILQSQFNSTKLYQCRFHTYLCS